MSKIAQVAVKMIVDGETKIYLPGETLPELSAHDDRELTKSKSIADPADLADDEGDDADRQRRAQARFDAVKRGIQEASASTSAGEQPGTASTASASELAPTSTSAPAPAPAAEPTSPSTPESGAEPVSPPTPAPEQTTAPAPASAPAATRKR